MLNNFHSLVPPSFSSLTAKYESGYHDLCYFSFWGTKFIFWLHHEKLSMNYLTEKVNCVCMVSKKITVTHLSANSNHFRNYIPMQFSWKAVCLIYRWYTNNILLGSYFQSYSYICITSNNNQSWLKKKKVKSSIWIRKSHIKQIHAQTRFKKPTSCKK